MCKDVYINFDGDVIRVSSCDASLLRDFKFVMREYVVGEQMCDYYCDLDQTTIFEQEVIARKFLIINGAAVNLCGTTYLFIAGPYSGKTSTICSMIERGAKLITDDLILINRKSRKVFVLRKPMCLRENAVNIYNINKCDLQQKGIEYRCFEDDYGPRFLLHPFDYFHGDYFEGEAVIDAIYVLKDGVMASNDYRSILGLTKNFKKQDMTLIVELCQKVIQESSFRNILNVI